MIGVIVFVFIAALVLGFPIAVAIGGAAVVPNLMDPAFVTNVSFIIRGMISGVNTFALLALPLFMLSGYIMSEGGISKKLFDVFALAVGKKTGGLPCAVILTCLFFGMISGSGPATCAAVGGMALPILIDLGYDKAFCGALIATAAGLAVIIPPSIPYITICAVTGSSIGNLMIAGILPGFIIAFCLMIWTYIYCRKHGEDKAKIAANYEALKSQGTFKILREAVWAILFPVIILGGIYGGLATPTEVACIAVFYALFIAMFIYKTISFRDIPRFLAGSVNTYAPICFLLAIATAFARVLTMTGAPMRLAGFVIGVIESKNLFILSVVVVLLIMGMFIDVGPANVILAPIFLPVARAFGVNDIHFLLVMVVCLAVGFVTPPFGMNLFVAAPMIQDSSFNVGKKAMPFIAANVIALLVISFVPWFSLVLLP
jgi:C4-dicarboxylate transporter DctM subunit